MGTPTISKVDSDCSFSSSYQTGVWNFQMTVKGDQSQVMKAYVDLYMAELGEAPVESWLLEGDGKGKFSQTVYEFRDGLPLPPMISRYLDCDQKYNFNFTFNFMDRNGQEISRAWP